MHHNTEIAGSPNDLLEHGLDDFPAQRKRSHPDTRNSHRLQELVKLVICKRYKERLLLKG